MIQTNPEKAALKRKKSKLNQPTASTLEVTHNQKTARKKPAKPGKVKSAFEAKSSEKKRKTTGKTNPNIENTGQTNQNFYNQNKGTFRAHIPNQYLKGPNYGQHPESIGREEYLGSNKRHPGIGRENFADFENRRKTIEENFNMPRSRYVEIPYVKGNFPPHAGRRYYQEAYTPGDSRRDQNYRREFRHTEPRYGEDYSNELYNPNWNYQRGYYTPENQHWGQSHHHYQFDRNRENTPEFYNQPGRRQDDYGRRNTSDNPSNYWNEFNDRSFRDRRWDDENRFRFERSRRYNEDNEK